MPFLKNILNRRLFVTRFVSIAIVFNFLLCLHFDNTPPEPEELEKVQTIHFKLEGIPEENIIFQFWNKDQPMNINFNHNNTTDLFGIYQNSLSVPYNQTNFDLWVLIDRDKNSTLNNMDVGRFFTMNLNHPSREYLLQAKVNEFTSVGNISFQATSSRPDGHYFCFFKPENITGNILPNTIEQLSSWQPQISFMIQASNIINQKSTFLPMGIQYEVSCVLDQNQDNVFVREDDEIIPLANAVTAPSSIIF